MPIRNDSMTPLSIEQLAKWIIEEGRSRESSFGIPNSLFFDHTAHANLSCFHMGHKLETPLGVAAGPHTQLAANIVCAYLVGARFIELKTVQILDELDVSKPCIDMLDVGFNCEWSQELRLQQSALEYAKAWVLIHWLRKDHLELDTAQTHTVFNMSLGYNLDGVRSKPITDFINAMRDAKIILDPLRSSLSKIDPKFSDIPVPDSISDNVTLSTMHGCPPEEISRIGLHLIEELGLGTTIKLNPTLLGKIDLLNILHGDLGHTNIVVPDEAFEHDPTYQEALDIVRSLASAAKQAGVPFAVKLTNTLETSNIEHRLPATEAVHFMSGRALHPLTLELANRFRRDLGSETTISIAGGADAFNVAGAISVGLLPVTVSSDLLRPGGYGRLKQYVEALERLLQRNGMSSIEELLKEKPGSLQALAADSRRNPAYAAAEFQHPLAQSRELTTFDCNYAPCRKQCPTDQRIPTYLKQIAERSSQKALKTILIDNPLPGTTGCVCPEFCSKACVRQHYDAPLSIRALKRFCQEIPSKMSRTQQKSESKPRIAVIGAGPCGMATAAFLASAKYRVDIYDTSGNAGGVPRLAIPGFRLPPEVLDRDWNRLIRLGVRAHFSQTLGVDISIESLFAEGFESVVLAIGGGPSRRLRLPKEDAQGSTNALDFLRSCKENSDVLKAKRILIIGGGNAAMDAARAAVQAAPKESQIKLVYRRTVSLMPASKEEISAARQEGVRILELVNPVSIITNDTNKVCGLECERTILSSAGDDGRRRPVPLENSRFILEADLVISAIGQNPQLQVLSSLGIACEASGKISVDERMETNFPNVYAGGDVVTGPATVIEAIAAGKNIASSIIKSKKRENKTIAIDWAQVTSTMAHKSKRQYPADDATRPGPTSAVIEAQRCLDCETLCGLCVTVCPNRANFLYRVSAQSINYTLWRTNLNIPEQTSELRSIRMSNTIQIGNLASLCNECGNCASFCPTTGAPYQKKPKICSTPQMLDAHADSFAFLSTHDGWIAKSGDHKLERDRDALHYGNSKFNAILTENFEVTSIEIKNATKETQILDLGTAARLFIAGEGLSQSSPWDKLDPILRS